MLNQLITGSIEPLVSRIGHLPHVSYLKEEHNFTQC
jgi:hypothetical protein